MIHVKVEFTNLWPSVWLRVKAGEVDALVTVLADDQIFALQ